MHSLGTHAAVSQNIAFVITCHIWILCSLHNRRFPQACQNALELFHLVRWLFANISLANHRVRTEAKPKREEVQTTAMEFSIDQDSFKSLQTIWKTTQHEHTVLSKIHLQVNMHGIATKEPDLCSNRALGLWKMLHSHFFRGGRQVFKCITALFIHLFIAFLKWGFYKFYRMRETIEISWLHS